MMNKIDIILKAKEILLSGTLPEFFRDHGEYCPFCLISFSKDELDKESGSGIGFSELVKQSIFGFESISSDKPLEDARDLLFHLEEPFTKDITLLEFNKILDKD